MHVRCQEELGDLRAGGSCTGRVEELSLNPAAIETCWGSAQLRVVRIVLLFIYLGLTDGFGGLIGLLILYSEARKRSAPSPRRRPRVEPSIP